MSIKYDGANSLTYLLQLLNTKFGTKVDKVEGKGLTKNELTDELKANYDAAYTHSTSTHAPTNAERNIIVGVQQNGTDLTPDANRKVNILVPEGASPSTTAPLMDGTASAGTSDKFSRGDHVHPSDSTKVDKVTGKGLSTNDYTTAEQTKLSGIATGATKVESSTTNGNIKINGTETTVYTHPSGTNPHGTTKSDVGLGNVGNFKAVSTVASQGLTDTEKSNARANIGAGTSSFSGSYNDLTNKPTIPTVNNATLTIQKNGTTVATFTANSSTATTANITVPTVPTISTDIITDATSDAKTASPKAVKTYVDSKVASTYKPAGSVTFANLPTPSASVLGNVYNLTEAFTTDSRFVEGAGKNYPAGTNVVVIDAGSSTYKFDVLPGFIDLSPYAKTEDIIELTNAEIQTIWDNVFGS